jgi:hypothetical protein
MRLVSSPEGTIPPYGASPITLQFVPLEARYYSATLPVLLSDGSQELVTLMVSEGKQGGPAGEDPEGLPPSNIITTIIIIIIIVLSVSVVSQACFPDPMQTTCPASLCHTSQGRGFHPDDPLTPPPLPSEGDRDWARWPGFSAFPCSGLGGCRLVVPSQDSLPLGVTTPRVSQRSAPGGKLSCCAV